MVKVRSPDAYVRAHLAGKDDGLVAFRPVLDRVYCFADLLLEDRGDAFAALRRAESTGRPVGTAEFVTGLERCLVIAAPAVWQTEWVSGGANRR